MDFSYISEQPYRIYLLLAFTRDEIGRVRAKDLRRYDILPTQASILMAIHRLGEEATPTTISRLIPRNSQTICGILNRMQKQGLIKRFKEPDDGKRTKIAMTDKGQKAFKLSIQHESINNVFDCLSNEEQKQLESYLLKLYKRATERNKKSGK